MKLIKMLTDRIQIKTNDTEFVNCHLNDLISITDGKTEIVTMISALTDNDTSQPLFEDDFVGQSVPSLKNIECNIIGSIVNGRFTNAVDKYPSTDVEAKIISNEEFAEMLKGNTDNSFSLGNYANYDCRAYINGNKFYQRHSCIVGNTGSGKSETVTKVLEETAKNTNCNIVVFDIHGEYSKLSYAETIKVGSDFSFPIWLFGFSDMVSNILKIKEESATVVMSALRKVYYTLCPDGNEGKSLYFSFDKMMLFLNALNEEMVGTGEFYKTGEKAGQEKEVKGDYNGKLSGIINTMDTIRRDKRYSFLFADESQNYLECVVGRIMGGKKPVKNIDLSEIPHEVAVMVIGVITKLIYNMQLMQKNTEINPITLVCDEAHVYIPTDFQLSASQKRMVEIFENIAKEGRKFGITLFVASQRPSELNRTIMAQCANYIVMKLNNENDKTMIKGIMADGSSGIIETTTMFMPGDALVIGDATPIPLKIKVDLAEERPQSKTIDFWSEWKKEREAVKYGVYLEEYLRN